MQEHLLPYPLRADTSCLDMTIYRPSRYREASCCLDTIDSESHNNKKYARKTKLLYEKRERRQICFENSRRVFHLGKYAQNHTNYLSNFGRVFGILVVFFARTTGFLGVRAFSQTFFLRLSEVIIFQSTEITYIGVSITMLIRKYIKDATVNCIPSKTSKYFILSRKVIF
jgi:hypothetical protein